MTYAIAKVARDALEGEVKAAALALRAIPGVGAGPMGLTPDAVKFSPEYRAAKATLDAAFASLRTFNESFTKAYAAEIRAERRAA